MVNILMCVCRAWPMLYRYDSFEYSYYEIYLFKKKKLNIILFEKGTLSIRLKCLFSN